VATAVARLSPGARVAAQVVLGLIVGTGTWWLVDAVNVRLHQRLVVGPGGVPAPLILLMVLIGLAGSGVIARFPAALAAAGGLLVIGIVVGLYFPDLLPAPGVLQGDTLIVPEGALNVRLIAVRGALEPAIHVLAGAWLAIAAWSLYRRRSSASGRLGLATG
jgi:hypothetical protein